MEAAMDLMRRISPNQSETALSALLTLLPHHSSDLLSQVDQPLQVFTDVECAKEFILCEYNRDADSYRSPWSNKYYPTLEDGSLPSTELRKLEIEANDVFAVYRDQYYEGGVSSVYLWEDDTEVFIACFLIKKDGSKHGHGRRGYLHEGSWEAIHLIEVGPEENGKAHYRLTSTVMLSMTIEDKPSGTFNLSGSIRRQMSHDLAMADGHLCNMGKMIEELEGKLRNSLDQIWLLILGLFWEDERVGVFFEATTCGRSNEIAGKVKHGLYGAVEAKLTKKPLPLLFPLYTAFLTWTASSLYSYYGSSCSKFCTLVWVGLDHNVKAEQVGVGQHLLKHVGLTRVEGLVSFWVLEQCGSF
ncbi:hypothetical protein HPP92_020454 [Vanilla planifolia]|uniref:F-actin-capping protein subunit beta n=2 Tax=Vanilla planifolia TaxID=51239 RepID=A0A835UHW3_VANPL|nr:hypothetical protein HPP92_020454 [Vanilla planifolia]